MPRPPRPPPKPKRQDRGRGSVSQQPGGWWLARMPRDGEGRRKAHRCESWDAGRAWLDSQLDPQGPTGADELLGRYLRRWLARHEPTLAPQSIERYRYAVRACLPIAERRVGDLDHTHFQDVLASMLRRGLAAATVTGTRAILHVAMEDLVPGVLAQNPLKRTRVQKTEPKTVEFWDEQEQAAILAAAFEHPLEPLVAIGLSAGLRIGELMALQWTDLGRDGVLTVQRSLHSRGKMVGPTKARRPRRIKLPGPLLALLASYRARQPFIGRWICSRPDGAPWGPEHFRRATTTLARKAGVKRLHPHAAYRHSAAYRLMAAGIIPNQVAAILGHSKASISVNTYGHFSPADEVAATAAMGRLFTDSEALGTGLGLVEDDSFTK